MLCAALLLGYISSGGTLTYQVILNYTPQNPILAAGTILLLFAVKSLIVVFPAAVIEFASGHLFPVVPALLVNFIGTAVSLCVSYWNGRRAGGEAVARFSIKYVKLASFMEKQRKHAFLLCLATRLIGCLPRDLVGMYLGAMKLPFITYLIAGMIGTFPSVLAATLVGSTISMPNTPLFVFSLLLFVGLTVGTSIIYWLYFRNSRGKGDHPGA